MTIQAKRKEVQKRKNVKARYNIKSGPTTEKIIKKKRK